MRRLLSIMVLLACGWPQRHDLQAQNSKKDPQAVDLLSQAAEAMGLNKKAVSKISASGTLVSWNGNAAASLPLRLKVHGFDKVQWEIDRVDGTAVTLIQGPGGSTRSRGKEKDLGVSDTAGRTLEWVPIVGIGYWLKSSDFDLVYTGPLAAGGQNLQQVSVKRILRGNPPPEFKQAYENSTRIELFLDSATSLPAFLRYYEHPRDWRVDLPVELYFSNFQKVGEVLIPHRVSRFRSGQKADTIEFSSFVLNPSLDASDGQP